MIHGNRDLMSTVVYSRGRVAAFIGRQKERARQHAAATHGRQGQSPVYSSTFLFYCLIFHIKTLNLWKNCQHSEKTVKGKCGVN